MADQDFNIKVVTTADTSGLKQTSAEMQKIREQQEKIRQDQGAAALFARIPPGGPPSKAPAAAAKEAESESDKLASHIQTNLTRTLVHAAGVGFVLELVHGLTEASKEIEKISLELNKQGEQLLKNAQEAYGSARFAKDESDQLKISDESLKRIAATRKTLNEINEKELSGWAKFSDSINRFAQGRADYANALSQEQQTAFDQYQQAQKEAMREIVESEKALGRSYEENVTELNRLITAETKRKDAARAANNAEDFVVAANNAQKYRKELEAITKEHERAAAAAERQAKADERAAEEEAKAAEQKAKSEDDFRKNAIFSSSAQTQAVLKNEKAASDARAAGHERDADLYEKTAEQLEKSMTPEQRQELESLRKLNETRVGRKATEGESQEAVNQAERNRINFERQLRGEQPLAEGGKDQGLIDAVRLAFDQSMQKYWGP